MKIIETFMECLGYVPKYKLDNCIKLAEEYCEKVADCEVLRSKAEFYENHFNIQSKKLKTKEKRMYKLRQKIRALQNEVKELKEYVIKLDPK